MPTVRLLPAVLLLAGACSGADPKPDDAPPVPAGAALPQHIAVAPASFLPVAEASRLWLAIAQEARSNGLVVAKDARIPGGFLMLAQSTRGLDRESPGVRAMRAEAHRLLRDGLGVDGVLYVELVRREAPIRDGVARWDGVVEPILAVGADPHDTARGYRGAVDAWSLRLWLEDAAGSLVAEGLGGLSIDTHLHAGRWEAGGDLRRLAAPGRLAGAIRMAMEDLTRS